MDSAIDIQEALLGFSRELLCCVCLSVWRRPMSLPCQHTFCKACIERALEAQQRCPICKLPAKKRMLRDNEMMESVVDAYRLLQREHVTISPSPTPPLVGVGRSAKRGGSQSDLPKGACQGASQPSKISFKIGDLARLKSGQSNEATTSLVWITNSNPDGTYDVKHSLDGLQERGIGVDRLLESDATVFDDSARRCREKSLGKCVNNSTFGLLHSSPVIQRTYSRKEKRRRFSAPSTSDTGDLPRKMSSQSNFLSTRASFPPEPGRQRNDSEPKSADESAIQSFVSGDNPVDHTSSAQKKTINHNASSAENLQFHATVPSNNTKSTTSCVDILQASNFADRTHINSTVSVDGEKAKTGEWRWSKRHTVAGTLPESKVRTMSEESQLALLEAGQTLLMFTGQSVGTRYSSEVTTSAPGSLVEETTFMERTEEAATTSEYVEDHNTLKCKKPTTQSSSNKSYGSKSRASGLPDSGETQEDPPQVPPRAKTFAPGDLVNVLSRTWPGINKPGGAARIVSVNEDGTYNVKYIIHRGSENNVHPSFIEHEEESGSGSQEDESSGGQTSENGAGSWAGARTPERSGGSRKRRSSGRPERLSKILAVTLMTTDVAEEAVDMVYKDNIERLKEHQQQISLQKPQEEAEAPVKDTRGVVASESSVTCGSPTTLAEAGENGSSNTLCDSSCKELPSSAPGKSGKQPSPLSLNENVSGPNESKKPSTASSEVVMETPPPQRGKQIQTSNDKSDGSERGLTESGGTASIEAKTPLNRFQSPMPSKRASVGSTADGKKRQRRKSVAVGKRPLLQPALPVVLATGLTASALKVLQSTCKSLGGRFVSDWSPRVTHLVAATSTSGRKRSSCRSIKYLTCLVGGRWIVSFDWIKASRKRGAFVPEADFELEGDEKVRESEGAPRRSRQEREESQKLAKNEAGEAFTGPYKIETGKENCERVNRPSDGEDGHNTQHPIKFLESLDQTKMHQGTNLFRGLTFWLHGDFGKASSVPEREAVQRLLRLGGGEVATTLKQFTHKFEKQAHSGSRNNRFIILCDPKSPCGLVLTSDLREESQMLNLSWALDSISAFAIRPFDSYKREDKGLAGR